MQNYKILSRAFGKLGWKKFDPERYSKKKEKDYLALAQYLKKILSNRILKEIQSPMKISNIQGTN